MYHPIKEGVEQIDQYIINSNTNDLNFVAHYSVNKKFLLGLKIINSKSNVIPP